MNERIKAIVKECFDVMPDEEALTQFTNMVIKACADICDDTKNETVSNGSPDYNEGRAMGAEICRNRIYRMINDERNQKA